jgi:hypothetical protein
MLKQHGIRLGGPVAAQRDPQQSGERAGKRLFVWLGRRDDDVQRVDGSRQRHVQHAQGLGDFAIRRFGEHVLHIGGHQILDHLAGVAADAPDRADRSRGLGPEKGFLRNFAFVAVMIGGLLTFFQLFQRYLYEPVLWWCLNHKFLFLCVPALILILGFGAWLGPNIIFGRIAQEYDAQSLSEAEVGELSSFERFKYELGGLRGRSWEEIGAQSMAAKLKWTLATTWKGFGKEFMPPLDEGSYLYMATISESRLRRWPNGTLAVAQDRQNHECRIRFGGTQRERGRESFSLEFTIYRVRAAGARGQMEAQGQQEKS